MRVLLDTNIILAYLRKDASVKPLFDRAASGEIQLVISVIIEFELLRFVDLTNEEELGITLLLDGMRIVGVERRTARIAADLWKRYAGGKRGKENDLLIAATAIEHGIPLCTRNVKDFRFIKEITLLTEPPPV